MMEIGKLYKAIEVYYEYPIDNEGNYDVHASEHELETDEVFFVLNIIDDSWGTDSYTVDLLTLNGKIFKEVSFRSEEYQLL